MMDRRYVIALVLVAVVVLVLTFPYLASAYTRSASLSRCAELESQLLRLRQQGGDLTESARISSELQACYQTARDAGAVLDLGSVLLRDCRTYQQQIDAEWGNLTTTVDADFVKRNNTRGTIIRAGGEMVRCLTQATERAESANALREIKQFVVEAIASSRARSKCYRENGPGCGRSGLSEPHGDEKDYEEARTTYLPLDALLSTINAKIARLESAPAARPAGAEVSLT